MNNVKHKIIVEPSKKIPVVYEADIVVCGGGPAGIMAAVAAGSLGANVVLIERYGFLGGMATAGLVRSLAGMSVNGRRIVGGFAWDMVKRMERINGSIADVSRFDIPMDSEAVKLVADEMILEAHVQPYYHSLVTDVIKEDEEIKGVFIENKSGRQAILGKIFIDATGDGDVAAKAGAPFEKGRQTDGGMLPMTMVFRLGGVDFEELEKKWEGQISKGTHQIRLKELMDQAFEKGLLPAFGGPWLKTFGKKEIRPGQIYANAVRIWGDSTKVEDLTNAEIQGRKDAWKIAKFLKANSAELANSYLAETATQIGIRESRRFIGDYILTLEDVKQSIIFEDTIALGGHPVDIHAITPNDTSQILEWLDKPYGIPYRCLIPQKLKNVYVAGRTISATHEAHASTRVMGTAMALGHAAGVAAYLALANSCNTRAVNSKEIRKILLNQDAILA